MMANLLLTASPIISVPDPDHTGTTAIKYDLSDASATTTVQLHWRFAAQISRLRPARWHKFDLATVMHTADFGKRGVFSLSSAVKSAVNGEPGLAPGEVLHVMALREDFPNEALDPNHVDRERVLGRLTIIAIRNKVIVVKKPTLHVDITDIGGTFYLRDLAATKSFRMQLRMSRQSPVIDPFTGAFLLGDEMSTGPTNFSLRNRLEISTLDPGNLYFCVIRLILENGDCYEFLDSPTGSIPFATKKRKVTAHWDSVMPHVDEDDAELNVRFSIFSGNRTEEASRTYRHTETHSDDRYLIPAPNTLVFGPYVVDQNNRTVYFETEATEGDGGLFDPSELSGAKTMHLTFPSGSGKEVVGSTPFSMSPDNEDDLSYTLEGSYQIDYSF